MKGWRTHLIVLLGGDAGLRTGEMVALHLERLHAEHTARRADVQSARSRLELLGVPEAALDAASGPELRASADIPAPIDGVVTERWRTSVSALILRPSCSPSSTRRPCGSLLISMRRTSQACASAVRQP